MHNTNFSLLSVPDYQNRSKEVETFIENNKIRSNAKQNRLKGLVKKANTLTKLCGGEILLVYTDERDNNYIHTNNDEMWAKYASISGRDF